MVTFDDRGVVATPIRGFESHNKDRGKASLPHLGLTTFVCGLADFSPMSSHILTPKPCHIQNRQGDRSRPTDDILAVSGDSVMTASGDWPRNTGDTSTDITDTAGTSEVDEVTIQDQQTQKPPPRILRCWINFGSLRRTATVIVLLAIVVVSVAVYYSHHRHTSSNNSNANGGSSNSTDASGANGNDSDEASRYLRDLRVQILGMDTFRLDPEADQMRATDWMTFVDTPRLALNQTARLKQRYALLVIYFAMGGKDWKFYGWANNPGVNECEWDRVYCNARGDVEQLQLGMQDVDMTGTLVGEIGLLSSLGEFSSGPVKCVCFSRTSSCS